MAATKQAKDGRARSMPRQYQEFKIRFANFNRQSGSFEVWVEGQMDPDRAAKRRFRAEDFWTAPEVFGGGPVGNLDQRSLEPAGLLALGEKLAGLALPEGQVRELFQKSRSSLTPTQGLRIRLLFPPVSPLAQLPWEVMALPFVDQEKQVPYLNFLALRPEISIVRSDLLKKVERKKIKAAGVRIAVALSSPADTGAPLDVSKDQKLIQKAQKRMNAQLEQEFFHVDVAERPTGGHALERLLEQGAEIFHYAGHGEYGVDLEQGVLLLEDAKRRREDYPADSLASLLSGAGVRLAVLGACDGGRRNGENRWGGMAPTLAQAGIPAVIASQFTINTENAERLVETLYPMLMSGFSVDEAVAASRAVLFRAGQQGDELQAGLKQRDWAALVLYLSVEDGVLFSPPPKTAESKPVMQKMDEIVIKTGKVTGTLVAGRLSESGAQPAGKVRIETKDVKNSFIIGAATGSGIVKDLLEAQSKARRKPRR